MKAKIEQNLFMDAVFAALIKKAKGISLNDNPSVDLNLRIVGEWSSTSFDPIRTIIIESTIADENITLRIKQEVNSIIGSSIWPSSVVLSKYLLRQSRVTSLSAEPMRHVLELGSGCGLTAIVLALTGHNVLATDKSDVLPLLADNVLSFQDSMQAEGRPVGGCRTLSLDWMDCSTSTSSQVISQLLDNRFELIVLSDCLYSAAAVGPLISLLALILHSRPSVQILLANEQRSALDEFLTCARKSAHMRPFRDVKMHPSELQISPMFSVSVRVLYMA